LAVGPFAQRQRFQERVADAGVGEPLLAVNGDEQRDVVSPRLVAPGGAQHAALDDVHREPSAPQQQRESTVHLVAEPAAPAAPELVEQRVRVEPDRPAELDVDVLVRDVGAPGAVQPAQRRQVRPQRGVDGEAGEQRADVHRQPPSGRDSSTYGIYPEDDRPVPW
jgi:hypothetical protein